jgi:hypothetical protein
VTAPTLPALAPAVADVRVVDLEGNAHRLGDLWARGTTLFVFLRHFG